MSCLVLLPTACIISFLYFPCFLYLPTSCISLFPFFPDLVKIKLLKSPLRLSYRISVIPVLPCAGATPCAWCRASGPAVPTTGGRSFVGRSLPAPRVHCLESRPLHAGPEDELLAVEAQVPPLPQPPPGLPRGLRDGRPGLVPHPLLLLLLPLPLGRRRRRSGGGAQLLRRGHPFTPSILNFIPRPFIESHNFYPLLFTL